MKRGPAIAGPAAFAAYALTTTVVRAQSSPTQLRVATAPEEDAVATLYAQESGIFRRLGLDVTVTAAASGSSIAAAVVGGTIDIGKSSLAGLITAHTKGIPFTLIAPAGEYNAELPITGTVALASSTIKSARDLSGKTVSVQSLRGSMQIGTMNWIDQNGGDSSLVHFIELPPSLVSQALESKRVDAATFANPELAEALATKNVRVIGWSQGSIGSHYLLAAYFTTIDFAQKNAATVSRFAQGLQQAATYTNAHHAETASLVSAFTKVSPAVVASMNRVTCGLQLDPREIQPLIDASVKYKLIPARFDAGDMIFTPPNG